MIRKLLLTMLATTALVGCATDYRYRNANGSGDYYYGQPRVEYRQLGPSGFYGGFGLGYGYGGLGANYYYDRYGRLVYGYPGGYYGSPYYGGNGWYRPRPPRNHGHRDDHDDGHGDGQADNTNRPDRRPPWRDLGGFQTREPNDNETFDREDRERRIRPPRAESPSFDRTLPQPRDAAVPTVRQGRDPSSRMGGFIGGAARGNGNGKRNTTPEE